MGRMARHVHGKTLNLCHIRFFLPAPMALDLNSTLTVSKPEETPFSLILTCVQLNDGNKIPRLGFGERRIRLSDEGVLKPFLFSGTYAIRAKDTKNVVTMALKVILRPTPIDPLKPTAQAGYRHIVRLPVSRRFRSLTISQDTATWYGNEKECGDAIREFCKATGTPRSAIFYTTKLRANNGYDATLAAIEYSLKQLGKDECGNDAYIDLYLIHDPTGGPEARKDSWRAICDAQKEGKLRSIGVSCFGTKHLGDILGMSLAVPAVNQVRLVRALSYATR